MSNEVMNKEKWILLFKEIGLDEARMSLWHKTFESKFPNEHQSFLEWLNIPENEISHIRSL